MHDDMADRGWLPVDLARAADVARSTVTRFLNGDVQTPHTARKLADALGKSVRRYVIRRVKAKRPTSRGGASVDAGAR